MGRLLNHGVRFSGRSLNAIEKQNEILKELGVELTGGRLETWFTEEDENRVDHLLESGWIGNRHPLVAINPGSSPRWHTKRWPAELYARLLDEVAKKYRVRCVITGSKRETELARKIAGLSGAHPIIACGKTTMSELAPLIQRCRVLVTGDCAPLHVAAAVGTPAVALFGPTGPERRLPPGARVRVIRKSFACSPCYRGRCFSHRCMKQISVEEVLGAVAHYLQPIPPESEAKNTSG